MLLLDGTSLRIAKDYSKPFWSYKFNKSGLRYEVALCIQTGSICWWIKPYAPGKWNDLSIFRDGLVWMLERGGGGARWIGTIKAPPQPTSNAQMSWRWILLLKKFSSGYEAGRRLSTRGLKIGLFYPACTVTTYWSTNLFSVLLLFSPSFRWRPTLCFK